MNEVKCIWNCVKNLGTSKQNYFSLDKGTCNTLRIHSTTSSRENILKNKEINRNKKQQIWMKKINVKELPRKKFGNKLGTVAKSLYLKYVNENCEENSVYYKNKYDVDYGEYNNCTILRDGRNSQAYEENGTQRGCNDKDKNRSKDNVSKNYSHVNTPLLNEKEQYYKQKGHTTFRFNSNINEVTSTLSNENVCKENCTNEPHYDKPLWIDICNELKYHLPFLQPYSISMALNYLSKMNYDEYNIFKLIAENVDERWIKNFNIKDLSQLLMSYSRLNSKYDSFVNLISRELLYKICFANFEEISLIAYSYTKMKIYDYEVFLHLCNETKHKMKKGLTQNLTNYNDTTYNGLSNIIPVCYNKRNDVVRNWNEGEINPPNDLSYSLKERKGKESFQVPKMQDIIYVKKTSQDKILPKRAHHGIKEPPFEVDNGYNKREPNQILDSATIHTQIIRGETENIDNEIEQRKKYSHICLLVYCLGKIKHRDDDLFGMVSEYINVEKINNIDISNLSYTFSVFNFYKSRYYEKFCRRSLQIVNFAQASQKVVIMTYLLKHPRDEMLSVYFSYVKNIRIEMEQKEIHKEPLLLNMCINSFSSDVFLDFILNIITSQEKNQEKEEKINQAYFILNVLIDYASFFMKNKKLCSRDFPKILNILLKIQGAINEYKGTILSYVHSHYKEGNDQKVNLLIEDLLDLIVRQMHTFHTFDLANIKNIFLGVKCEWQGVQSRKKAEEIFNFVNK
ncbi:hypothetical protein, conserved [Plasmodium gonderi]|uniref:Uncharacterized protein n=1 Tax=Plasmodium gonderi TaxID=77519 RepID=A0A1Y1JK69_PLAGO|nr:hypothetical protein, conserved [Plasmodium gonderi]GAW81182.1 hypothetical protein, conserved [Plasmodium gonderi]